MKGNDLPNTKIIVTPYEFNFSCVSTVRFVQRFIVTYLCRHIRRATSSFSLNHVYNWKPNERIRLIAYLWRNQYSESKSSTLHTHLVSSHTYMTGEENLRRELYTHVGNWNPYFISSCEFKEGIICYGRRTAGLPILADCNRKHASTSVRSNCLCLPA